MRILISLILTLCSVSCYANNMMGMGSAPDPYIMNEPTDATVLPGYRNTDGRTLSNPQNIGGAKKCVVAFFGQSNSATNYQQGAYVVLNPSVIWNLNPYNGGLYNAAVPILGGGGPPPSAGETWVYRYADKLIASGSCDRVVIVPAAISSTFVADWASGGQMNNRISAVAKRITAAGLQTSGVIFQQGESDNVAGTSEAAYAASLASVIASIQASFPTVPIFVSQTSYYIGTTSANVTNAQLAAVDGVTVFDLGNSDLILAGGRWDNIHFNATGSDSWSTTASTNSNAILVAH